MTRSTCMTANQRHLQSCPRLCCPIRRDEGRGFSGAKNSGLYDQLPGHRCDESQLRRAKRWKVWKRPFCRSDRKASRESSEERPSLPPIFRRLRAKCVSVRSKRCENVRKCCCRHVTPSHPDDAAVTP